MPSTVAAMWVTAISGRSTRNAPARVWPLASMAPSEYMKCGRVWVACEPEEKTIPYVSQWIGEGQILYASDYPHWDGGFPESVSTLADRTDVTDSLKRRIFFDNPQRFYGM